MRTEVKIARLMLFALAFALFVFGYGLLIYIDWRIALSVLLVIWSNNILQNMHSVK